MAASIEHTSDLATVPPSPIAWTLQLGKDSTTNVIWSANTVTALVVVGLHLWELPTTGRNGGRCGDSGVSRVSVPFVPTRGVVAPATFARVSAEVVLGRRLAAFVGMANYRYADQRVSCTMLSPQANLH